MIDAYAEAMNLEIWISGHVNNKPFVWYNLVRETSIAANIEVQIFSFVQIAGYLECSYQYLSVFSQVWRNTEGIDGNISIRFWRHW